MNQEELDSDCLLSTGSLVMTCSICDEQIDATANEELNYHRMTKHFYEKHNLKND